MRRASALDVWLPVGLCFGPRRLVPCAGNRLAAVVLHNLLATRLATGLKVLEGGLSTGLDEGWFVRAQAGQGKLAAHLPADLPGGEAAAARQDVSTAGDLGSCCELATGEAHQPQRHQRRGTGKQHTDGAGSQPCE